MSRNMIWEAIDNEREYQQTKWGDTDKQNTEYNWAAYIGAYTNRSLIGYPGLDIERRRKFKQDMIKVAALAIAAIENLD